MAEAFQLTAQVVLKGPDVRPFRGKLSRGLGKLKYPIKFDVRTSITSVKKQLKTRLKGFKVPLRLTIPKDSAKRVGRLSTSFGLLTKRIKQAGIQKDKFILNLGKLNANVKINIGQTGRATTATKGMTKAMTSGAKASQSYAHGIYLAGSRYSKFIIATSGAFLALRALRGGLADAIGMENALIKVAQVSGTSLANIRGLGMEIRSVSSEYGIAGQELAKISLLLKQSGFSLEKVAKLMPVFAKAKLSPTISNLDDVANAVILLQRFGQTDVSELERSLSAINTIAGQFPVEAQDLIAGLSKAGGAFLNTSNNVRELIALMTALRASTRESASTLAVSLRTVVSRLQREANIRKLRQQLGVELVDKEGGFVGVFESFRRLAQARERARTPKQKLEFTQVLGGVMGLRQESRMLSLISNMTMAEQALAASMKDTNSLTRDAAIAQETLAVKAQKTVEQFGALFDKVIASDDMRNFAKQGLEAANSMIKFAGSLDKTVGALSDMAPLLAIMGMGKLGYGAIGGRGGRTGFGPKTGFFKQGKFTPTRGMRGLIGRRMPRMMGGPAGGLMAGMGMQMATNQMQEGQAKDIAQSISSGLTAGFMVGIINPWAGAVVGVITGLTALAQSARDAGQRLRMSRMAGVSDVRTDAYLRAYLSVSATERAKLKQRALGGDTRQPGELFGRPTLKGLKERWRAGISGRSVEQLQADELKEDRAAQRRQEKAMLPQLEARLTEMLTKGRHKDPLFKKLRDEIIRLGGVIPKETQSIQALIDNVDKLTHSMSSLDMVIANVVMPRRVRALQDPAGRISTGLKIGTQGYGRALGRISGNERSKAMARDVNEVFINLKKAAGLGLKLEAGETHAAITRKQFGLMDPDIINRVNKALNEVTNLDEATQALQTEFRTLLSTVQKLGVEEDKRIQQLRANLTFLGAQTAGVRGAKLQSIIAQMVVGEQAAKFKQRVPGNVGVPLGGVAGVGIMGGASTPQALMIELEALTRQFAQSRGKNIELLPVIDDVKRRLAMLGDTALTLRNAQEKLADLESKRRARLSLRQGFFGGGLQARQQMTRDVITASMAVRTGDLGRLNIFQQQATIRALSGPLANIANVFGTGKTGRELLDKLLGGAGLGRVPEQRDITRLQKEVLIKLQEAANIQKELAEHEIRMREVHLKNVDTANKKFLSDLGNKLAEVLRNDRIRNIPEGQNPFVEHAAPIKPFGEQIMPEKVDVNLNAKHDIVLNGAQVMAELIPSIKAIATEETIRALNKQINPITGETAGPWAWQKPPIYPEIYKTPMGGK